MAKQQSFPGMPAKGSVLPKLIGTLVALGLFALVVNQPLEAAHLAKNLGGMLMAAINGIATFINQAAG